MNQSQDTGSNVDQTSHMSTDKNQDPHRNAVADAKAAKAYAKATRPWYKKKRWWAVGLVLVIAMATAVGGGGDDGDTVAKDNTSSQESKSSDSGNKKAAAPKEKSEPEMTPSQENALKSAQNYIDIMPFSKEGLIQQLSSSAGDGYSKADATFAANKVDADWNAEALEAAEGYQELMPMSRDGLIQQLTSSAGDKFTREQAVYAVDKLGL